MLFGLVGLALVCPVALSETPKWDSNGEPIGAALVAKEPRASLGSNGVCFDEWWCSGMKKSTCTTERFQASCPVECGFCVNGRNCKAEGFELAEKYVEENGVTIELQLRCGEDLNVPLQCRASGVTVRASPLGGGRYRCTVPDGKDFAVLVLGSSVHEVVLPQRDVRRRLQAAPPACGCLFGFNRNNELVALDLEANTQAVLLNVGGSGLTNSMAVDRRDKIAYSTLWDTKDMVKVDLVNKVVLNRVTLPELSTASTWSIAFDPVDRKIIIPTGNGLMRWHRVDPDSFAVEVVGDIPGGRIFLGLAYDTNGDFLYAHDNFDGYYRFPRDDLLSEPLLLGATSATFHGFDKDQCSGPGRDLGFVVSSTGDGRIGYVSFDGGVTEYANYSPLVSDPYLGGIAHFAGSCDEFQEDPTNAPTMSPAESPRTTEQPTYSPTPALTGEPYCALECAPGGLTGTIRRRSQCGTVQLSAAGWTTKTELVTSCGAEARVLGKAAFVRRGRQIEMILDAAADFLFTGFDLTVHSARAVDRFADDVSGHYVSRVFEGPVVQAAHAVELTVEVCEIQFPVEATTTPSPTQHVGLLEPCGCLIGVNDNGAVVAMNLETDTQQVLVALGQGLTNSMAVDRSTNVAYATIWGTKDLLVIDLANRVLLRRETLGALASNGIWSIAFDPVDRQIIIPAGSNGRWHSVDPVTFAVTDIGALPVRLALGLAYDKEGRYLYGHDNDGGLFFRWPRDDLTSAPEMLAATGGTFHGFDKDQCEGSGRDMGFVISGTFDGSVKYIDLTDGSVYDYSTLVASPPFNGISSFADTALCQFE